MTTKTKPKLRQIIRLLPQNLEPMINYAYMLGQANPQAPREAGWQALRARGKKVHNENLALAAYLPRCCSGDIKLDLVPAYLRERVAGMCRSLAGVKLLREHQELGHDLYMAESDAVLQYRGGVPTRVILRTGNNTNRYAIEASATSNDDLPCCVLWIPPDTPAGLIVPEPKQQLIFEALLDLYMLTQE